MKPNVVGFIFARGGSKGVPRKNIRMLAGKPLIAYAIETGFSSRYIQRVVVSTDDAEIASVARQFGAEVPFMRPAELACDDAPESLSWQHALRTLADPDLDVFVSLPPTSPLRMAADVDSCIETLLSSDADIVITVTPATRNPYFNMVILDTAGVARLVIPPERAFQRRQSAPPVFDVTTVAYAVRPEFVLGGRPLFEGRVRAVVVPSERAVDIDTELDFHVADMLMTQRIAEGGHEIIK